VDEDQSGQLFAWADLTPFPQVIASLADMALDEQWFCGDPVTAPNKYPKILDKYHKFTYYRLRMEGKVREDGRCAAFNTGLLNKRYMDIYAIFNRSFTGRWKFREFAAAGENAGKDMVKVFGADLPRRAQYYNMRSDTFMDPSLRIYPDWEHILVENAGRMPEPFLRKALPAFEFKNPRALGRDERRDYWHALGDAIRADQEAYNDLQQRFGAALNIALKRVEMNFRTVVPMYYSKSNRMSLLLPIRLLDEEQPDLALVLDKDKGVYSAPTVLTLDMAYQDARLIAKPESSWLRLDKVEDSDLGSNDNDDEN
jgi:hypothetical protein